MIQPIEATLKTSGAMELDLKPSDGVPELVLLWDMKGNNFTAHVDVNGVTDFWEIHGTFDPKTLSVAGQCKVKNPNQPIDLLLQWISSEDLLRESLD